MIDSHKMMMTSMLDCMNVNCVLLFLLFGRSGSEARLVGLYDVFSVHRVEELFWRQLLAGRRWKLLLRYSLAEVSLTDVVKLKGHA